MAATVTTATTAGPMGGVATTQTSAIGTTNLTEKSSTPTDSRAESSQAGGKTVSSFGPQWTSVHDQYQTLEILGQGTYGVVYKAIHKVTKQIVGLKRCRLDTFKDFGIPETTLREISLLRDLRHENIMTLYQVSCNTVRLYMICEYLDLDLKKYIRANRGGIPLGKVKEITFAILQGLSFCHGHRIIHRDLKPHNVLVSSDASQVKIADFGLARSSLVPGKTLTHEVITLWYRAPELLLGHCNYNTGVDMWSAGCIVAELLSSSPLYAGDSEIDTLFRICRLLGTPPKEHWPAQAVVAWDDFPKLKGKPQPFASLSPELDEDGQNFLSSLLQFRSELRLTATEALYHPWLREVREARLASGAEAIPRPEYLEWATSYPADTPVSASLSQRSEVRKSEDGARLTVVPREDARTTPLTTSAHSNERMEKNSQTLLTKHADAQPAMCRGGDPSDACAANTSDTVVNTITVSPYVDVNGGRPALPPPQPTASFPANVPVGTGTISNTQMPERTANSHLPASPRDNAESLSVPAILTIDTRTVPDNNLLLHQQDVGLDFNRSPRLLCSHKAIQDPQCSTQCLAPNIHNPCGDHENLPTFREAATSEPGDNLCSSDMVVGRGLPHLLRAEAGPVDVIGDLTMEKPQLELYQRVESSSIDLRPSSAVQLNNACTDASSVSRSSLIRDTLTESYNYVDNVAHTFQLGQERPAIHVGCSTATRRNSHHTALPSTTGGSDTAAQHPPALPSSHDHGLHPALLLRPSPCPEEQQLALCNKQTHHPLPLVNRRTSHDSSAHCVKRVNRLTSRSAIEHLPTNSLVTSYEQNHCSHNGPGCIHRGQSSGTAMIHHEHPSASTDSRMFTALKRSSTGAGCLFRQEPAVLAQTSANASLLPQSHPSFASDDITETSIVSSDAHATKHTILHHANALDDNVSFQHPLAQSSSEADSVGRGRRTCTAYALLSTRKRRDDIALVASPSYNGKPMRSGLPQSEIASHCPEPSNILPLTIVAEKNNATIDDFDGSLHSGPKGKSIGCFSSSSGTAGHISGANVQRPLPLCGKRKSSCTALLTTSPDPTKEERHRWSAACTSSRDSLRSPPAGLFRPLISPHFRDNMRDGTGTKRLGQKSDVTSDDHAQRCEWASTATLQGRGRCDHSNASETAAPVRVPARVPSNGFQQPVERLPAHRGVNTMPVVSQQYLSERCLWLTNSVGGGYIPKKTLHPTAVSVDVVSRCGLRDDLKEKCTTSANSSGVPSYFCHHNKLAPALYSVTDNRSIIIPPVASSAAPPSCTQTSNSHDEASENPQRRPARTSTAPVAVTTFMQLPRAGDPPVAVPYRYTVYPHNTSHYSSESSGPPREALAAGPPRPFQYIARDNSMCHPRRASRKGSVVAPWELDVGGPITRVQQSIDSSVMPYVAARYSENDAVYTNHTLDCSSSQKGLNVSTRHENSELVTSRPGYQVPFSRSSSLTSVASSTSSRHRYRPPAPPFRDPVPLRMSDTALGPKKSATGPPCEEKPSYWATTFHVDTAVLRPAVQHCAGPYTAFYGEPLASSGPQGRLTANLPQNPSEVPRRPPPHRQSHEMHYREQLPKHHAAVPASLSSSTHAGLVSNCVSQENTIPPYLTYVPGSYCNGHKREDIDSNPVVPTRRFDTLRSTVCLD